MKKNVYNYINVLTKNISLLEKSNVYIFESSKNDINMLLENFKIILQCLCKMFLNLKIISNFQNDSISTINFIVKFCDQKNVLPINYNLNKCIHNIFLPSMKKNYLYNKNLFIKNNKNYPSKKTICVTCKKKSKFKNNYFLI